MSFTFEKEWIDTYRHWITAVDDDPYRVYCKACNRKLTVRYSGYHALNNHENSAKHNKNMLEFIAKQKGNLTQTHSDKSSAELPIRVQLRNYSQALPSLRVILSNNSADIHSTKPPDESRICQQIPDNPQASSSVTITSNSASIAEPHDESRISPLIFNNSKALASSRVDITSKSKNCLNNIMVECLTEEMIRKKKQLNNCKKHTPTPRNQTGDPMESPSSAQELRQPTSPGMKNSENDEANADSVFSDESSPDLPNCSKLFKQHHPVAGPGAQKNESYECLGNVSQEQNEDDFDCASSFEYPSVEISSVSSEQSLFSPRVYYYDHLRSLDTCLLASTTSLNKASEICKTPGKTGLPNEESNYRSRPGHSIINHTHTTELTDSFSENSFRVQSVDPGHSPHSESPYTSEENSEKEISVGLDSQSGEKSAVKAEHRVLSSSAFLSSVHTDSDGDSTLTHLSENPVSQEPYPDPEPSNDESIENGAKEQVHHPRSMQTDQEAQNVSPHYTQFKKDLKTNYSNSTKKAKSNSNTTEQKFSSSEESGRSYYLREVNNFLSRLDKVNLDYERTFSAVVQDFEKFLCNEFPLETKYRSSYSAMGDDFMSQSAISSSCLKLLSLLYNEPSSRKTFSGGRQTEGGNHNYDSRSKSKFSHQGHHTEKEFRNDTRNLFESGLELPKERVNSFNERESNGRRMKRALSVDALYSKKKLSNLTE